VSSGVGSILRRRDASIGQRAIEAGKWYRLKQGAESKANARLSLPASQTAQPACDRNTQTLHTPPPGYSCTPKVLILPQTEPTSEAVKSKA